MVRQAQNLVFVYGTLRGDVGHDMSGVLARDGRMIGEAAAQGELYDLGDYPGMRLSRKPNSRVLGEVYELAPERTDSLLKTLDEYEGISPGEPEPHMYRRELIPVRLADDRTVEAWAYVLADPNPRYPRIESGDYVKWKRERRGS